MRLVQLKTCWLIALVISLAACQGAPPPVRPTAKDTGSLAAEALERGDYGQAAELYRAALANDPGNLKLHYGLAVAASYLDRRAEAVTEFTWVLDRAPSHSDEAKTAHQWLMSVGALPRTRSALAQDAPAPDASSTNEKEKTGYATVEGRVLFGDTPGAVAPMKRMQLLLYDYPSKENYFRMRTDETGQFRFTKVPPGVYKLTDRVAGHPTWRLRVELKAGQELSVELHPGNSTKVRDDFPEPASEPSS
jgi:tetratricopeptide (TPR) repeat protein